MCPLWAGVYPVAWRWKSAARDDGRGGLWRGVIRHSTGADPRPENRNSHWAPRYDWSQDTPRPIVGNILCLCSNKHRALFKLSVSLSSLRQIKWSHSALLSKRKSKPVSRSIPRGHVLFKDWRGLSGTCRHTTTGCLAQVGLSLAAVKTNKKTE